MDALEIPLEQNLFINKQILLKELKIQWIDKNYLEKLVESHITMVKGHYKNQRFQYQIPIIFMYV